MKNLKFKISGNNLLETDELTGKQGVYKACVDELNFYGWLLEVGPKFSKSVYHYENNNLNEIKKNLKQQLESLGVKFEKQIRAKKS
jgi:hypothetical protein